MTAPNATTLDLITQLCSSRAGELQGLPAGCMPGSMCAAEHIYFYAFWLTLCSGALLGIAGTKAWQTHISNRKISNGS